MFNPSARRRWPSLVAALFLILVMAPRASAHRDGCHRWHSCPSDTGSYVCGDLGYDTYCPDALPPAAPTDYEAPSLPTISGIQSRQGRVNVAVSAERGSRLRVSNDTGKVVTSARATGGRQALTFRDTDGSHAYRVTATDAAGNASDVATFSAFVDGTAPRAAAVAVVAPTGRLAYTTARVTGEPNTRYRVTVLHSTTHAAVAHLSATGLLDSTGSAEAKLLAANGAYLVQTTLTDSAGNTSSVTGSALTVRLPAPTLAIERTTPPHSSGLQLLVSGPATGSGVLQLTGPGSPPASHFTLDAAGSAQITLEVADGMYGAIARVTDFQRRSARATVERLLVDSVAPELVVALDRHAAKNSFIAASFSVEEGARVEVSGLPGGHSRTFSEPGPQQLKVQAKDGSYHLSFHATDAAGNETERDMTIDVEHPLTFGEAAAGLGTFTALAAALFFVLRALWRRRFDFAARREASRLTREHKQRLAHHHALTAQHAHDSARYDQALLAWTRETERLARLVHEARTYDGYELSLPDGIKPKPGEVLYSHVERGGMVEYRRPSGVDVLAVVDSGPIWITTHRVLFEGAKRREWSYDRLEQVHHIRQDQTLMQVSNRKQASGIDYSGPHQSRTRLHFELARVAVDGGRASVVAEIDLAATRHAETRPRPPAPLPNAPIAPTLPTAEDMRSRAEARKSPVAATS